MRLLDPKKLPETTAGLIKQLTNASLTKIKECFMKKEDLNTFENAKYDAIYYLLPEDHATEGIKTNYIFLYYGVNKGCKILQILYDRINNNTIDEKKFCIKFDNLEQYGKKWTIIAKEKYETYYRAENPGWKPESQESACTSVTESKEKTPEPQESIQVSVIKSICKPPILMDLTKDDEKQSTQLQLLKEPCSKRRNLECIIGKLSQKRKNTEDNKVNQPPAKKKFKDYSIDTILSNLSTSNQQSL